MARWLVTGGAGFIGSHLVEALIARGEHVRVLDNFSTGHKRNLLGSLKKIDLVQGDIRDRKKVRHAVRGIDFILHQAALRSVVRSLDTPIETTEVNVEGTVTLLTEARAAHVKRLVYASSSSIYGDSPVFPQSPQQTPRPVSPYAASKLAAEDYCHVFSQTMGLSTVCLRYFNVFGPRMDPKSKYALVIHIFMEAAYRGQAVSLHGDGRQSRDFCYIENIINANLLAARASSAASGCVFNVGCGESHSLRDYIALLEKLSGHKMKIKKTGSRVGDIRKTWADISATTKYLNYKPLVKFEEGIEKTWDYFRWEKER